MKFLQVTQHSKLQRQISNVYLKKENYTFDELCAMYPHCVFEMSESDYARSFPSWGTGYYTADPHGYAECTRDNWDTSD